MALLHPLRRSMAPSLLTLAPLRRSIASSSRLLSAAPPAPSLPSDAVHPPPHIHPPSPSPAASHSVPKHRSTSELPPRSWLAPQSAEVGYAIPRSRPFRSLPVYTKVRPAKKSVWTLIRKVEGSLEELKRHVLMDFPDSRPVVRQNARQIQMRGSVVNEVKLWLSDRGF